MSDETSEDVSESSLRSVIRDLADAAPPAPPVEDIFGPFVYTKGVPEMRSRRWRWAAAAAAVVVLVVGAVAVLATDDNSSTNVAADAGCGLSESATITATVDASGESVTFDVTSDPACSGVEVKVLATPATQGIPIDQNLTLDDAGAASVTDQLFGTRKVKQDWSIELIVSDTGAVAATGDFTVAQLCDFEETADLQVTYLAETNEVSIVLVVDPQCAGTEFTFDPTGGEILAPSIPGGVATYTVDETGRIEVTERVLASGPIIQVEAIPAGGTQFLIEKAVARATLDIGG